MMKTTVKRFRPESVVSFFTEEGELVARSKPKDQGDAINGDIISIATSNDLSTDAGTFQLTLTARKRWDKSLASNDLVIIRMRRNKEDEKASTVFFGLIDDVRKSTSIQQNTAQRTVTVSGRNFAKALINFEVGVVQEVEMTSASMGWLQGRVTFTGESSGKIVEGILKELVFKYMKYKFNNGKTLEDLLKTKLDSREGEKLLDEKSFVNFQGSMLAFIKEVIDTPFNQFFFEVYDGEPNLVVRATPFNKDKWDKLPLHEVSDEDVVSDDTGRSDLESYSLFSVGVQQIAGGFDTSKSTGVVPLWNEKYFEKYGLKRLHRFTAYVGFAGGGDSADSSESLKKYQEDLYNWNILNPRFYNGMLVVRGENKYKIGDRILRKSVEDGRDIEFFIEGVSHEFVNFSHWITKLSVTRGLDEKGAGRFKEPWGTGKDYEAGALGTAAGGNLNGGGTGGGGTSTGGTGTGGGLLPPGMGGSAKQLQIVNTALSWKSKPNRYVFGGGRTTSDIARGVFDCSSWIRYVYEQCGINAGPLSGTTTDTLAKLGQAVPSVNQLQLGDLVMFNTYKHNGHVTIYIGNGKCIGTQTNQGVAEIDMQWWINKYGLGSMRRLV
ncbi:NlpC/P60 family protein [Bacillus phage YungSlug]|nr:NlpC/P60 family protein [Bacillus phage YungSlug]